MMLSVIIPNYNHAHYLKGCLDAVFAHQLSMEVIVIDDASTDHSREVLRDYSHPITILYNQQNQGVIRSVNRALQQCHGKYVAFLAADDFHLPPFYQTCLEALEAYPQAALCSTDLAFLVEEAFVEKISLLPLTQPTLFSPAQVAHHFFHTAYWIPTHATLYRTSAVRAVGLWNEKLYHHGDWFANLQIAFSQPVLYIPKILTLMRKLSTSYSATQQRTGNKKSLQHLMQLLDEPQCDPIRTYFRTSGVLTQLGPHAKRFLLQTPRRWNYLFPLLKRKAYKLLHS